MANLPVVFDDTMNQYPVLPAEIMQELAAMNDMFKDFAGGGFRRIKARRMDFQLIGDGTTIDVPANELCGVLLCAAPYNHCVWYAKNFQPGQEPDSPDLVWIQKSAEDFPDALPAQYRKKIMINGSERWGFQILRRTVWAIARKGADGQLNVDYDKPYVLDLSSMSLYGKGAPENNMYKFSGLVSLCKQQSSNAYIVMPNMFLTQICLDSTATVTGPLVFRPLMNGREIKLLPQDHIMSSMKAMKSQEVADLLNVREKLDYKNTGVQGVATGAQVAQMAETAMAAPVQPAQTFVVPAAPAAPVQPVQPAAPAQPMQDAGMASLLEQAQAALSGSMTAPTPAAAPAPAPAPVQAAPESSSAASSINDLLAALR